MINVNGDVVKGISKDNVVLEMLNFQAQCSEICGFSKRSFISENSLKEF